MNRSHVSRPRSKSPLLGILTVLWGLFVIYATTIPFDLDLSAEGIEKSWSFFLEDPFFGRSLPDVVSNVLLFIPWGLLFGVGRAARRSSVVAAVLLACASALLLSSFVEVVQLGQASRTTSLLDLITNVFGALCGAVAGWLAAIALWPNLRPYLEFSMARRPLGSLAVVVSGTLFFVLLGPYDFSLDVGSLKTAVKESIPIPFGPPLRGEALPVDPLGLGADFLAWILIGGILALAVEESGVKSYLILVWTFILALLLSSAIELAQITVVSRSTDATTVLIACLGAVVGGVMAASRPEKDPRCLVGLAIGILVASMFLAAWAPLDFHAPEGWSWTALVPFLPYYQKTNVNALADVLRETIAFVPFGALLAAHGSRPSGVAIAAWGLLCGCVLEVGHAFLPARTADVTDVIVAGVGAAMGGALWRWLRGRWRELTRRQRSRVEERPGPPFAPFDASQHPHEQRAQRTFGFRDP